MQRYAKCLANSSLRTTKEFFSKKKKKKNHYFVYQTVLWYFSHKTTWNGNKSHIYIRLLVTKWVKIQFLKNGSLWSRLSRRKHLFTLWVRLVFVFEWLTSQRFLKWLKKHVSLKTVGYKDWSENEFIKAAYVPPEAWRTNAQEHCS